MNITKEENNALQRFTVISPTSQFAHTSVRPNVEFVRPHSRVTSPTLKSVRPQILFNYAQIM